MSSQSSQRLPRRNASPSTKQGPLKATLPFSSLVHGSPTRTNGRKGSPSLSPTSQWGPEKVKRWSPENRVSPERRSPNSPIFNKVERPKPMRPSPTGVRYDSANQYLIGQWPRDTHFHTGPTARESQFQRINTEDKYTQTPEEWEDGCNERKKKHKRSASVGNGDLQLALYRQRLQRNTKESGKPSTNHRQSPVPANHFTPPAGAHYTVAAVASKAIGIPTIPNRVTAPPSRCSLSLEGLNQEIENFVLCTHSMIDDEFKLREPAPDGHRAPVMELMRGVSTGTRSIDTQTPSSAAGYGAGPNAAEGPNCHSSCSSRSHSISPSFPVTVASGCGPHHHHHHHHQLSECGSGSGGSRSNSATSRGSSANSATSYDNPTSAQNIMELSMEGFLEIKADDCDSPEPSSLPKNAFSPLPNKSYSFVREPPDGCEKVNITQENRLAPVLKEHLFFCPSKESQLVLKPSDRSAFCPPYNLLGTSAVASHGGSAVVGGVSASTTSAFMVHVHSHHHHQRYATIESQ